MNKKSIHKAELISRYLRDDLSGSELSKFEDWLREDKRNRAILARFKETRNIQKDIELLRSIDLKAAWQKQDSFAPAEKRRIFWYYVAAASVLLMLGISFLLWNKVEITSELDQAALSKEIEPAKKGARLILADGSDYRVDSAEIKVGQEGIFLNQDHGELFTAFEVDDPESMKYNTLEVPKANYFKIQLSDGTQVWVNALSKLQFPVNFSASERRVFLEGEAYFDVAHDSLAPFIVEANGTEIKVLGTEFNVNTHANKVKAVLKEGSVEINNGIKSMRLLPGEFASITDAEIRKGKADIEREIAWKNDEFLFRNDNIITIASEISKWYNVDVKFRGDVSPRTLYSGSVSRKANLSETLQVLEFVSDLRFEVNKKELIIKSK